MNIIVGQFHKAQDIIQMVKKLQSDIFVDESVLNDDTGLHQAYPACG